MLRVASGELAHNSPVLDFGGSCDENCQGFGDHNGFEKAWILHFALNFLWNLVFIDASKMSPFACLRFLLFCKVWRRITATSSSACQPQRHYNVSRCVAWCWMDDVLGRE